MLIARSSIYSDFTYTHLLCACVLVSQSVIVCLHSYPASYTLQYLYTFIFSILSSVI